MPRTKQIRKKSSIVKKYIKKTSSLNQSESTPSSSLDNDELAHLLSKEYGSKKELVEEFEKFYNGKIKIVQQGYENACAEVHKMIKNLRESFPASWLSTNINFQVPEDEENQNTDPNVQSTRGRTRSRTPDESFPFKKPKTPSLTISRKRSVSASAVPSSQSKGGFKTPSMSSRRMMSNSVITPKVYGNTPMPVMRRPQTGEVAVSMSGSPLMVSAISSEEIPTVNVPLQDGRVFSILPEPGDPPPDFPEIDETTKQYLKTLRAHLEVLAPNTP